MTSVPIMLVVALVLLVWFAFRAEAHRHEFVPCTAERAMHSLRERVARGELTTDDYHRLVALMS